MTTTAHDFDFFVGEWDIANRRLKQRWVGSQDWDEFPALSCAQSVFAGAANFDEISFPTKGFSGLTLRLFDPERREWSLYWVNSARGLLLPPVVGHFDDDRGVFLGDDVDEGRKIRVRFVWSEITARSARWEQAFSDDGERTWETNWIMEMSRRTDGLGR